MKGLLLKDFYVALKSCKMYFIVDAFFIAMSFALSGILNDSIAFLMFPVLISGEISISLLSFDEKSKWSKYSGALPYSPAQLVSAKYLFGLIFQVLTTVTVFIASCLWVNFMSGMAFAEALVTLFGMFVFSLIMPAVGMPLCYKFGTEKGRLIIFVVLFAITMLVLNTSDMLGHAINNDVFIIMIIAAVVGTYALSWIFSIWICRGREITN